MSPLPRRSVCWLLLVVLVATAAPAAEPAMMRIARRQAADRNALLAAGVPLVAELSSCFLAFGDPARVAGETALLGLDTRVLDRGAGGERYALVGLRAGGSEEELARCGRVVWGEENWALLAARRFDAAACTDSTGWFLKPLTLEVLQPTRPPPPDYAETPRGFPPLVYNPLVQELVDAMTPQFATANWSAVVGAADTRYSPSDGCFAAAASVHATLSSAGLATEYHDYHATYAPSVIATIEGSLHPEDVFIAIGHLDDMPSWGPAPGANDNASGAAMVMALARLMSSYAFANTVKFIAVTGEEQGLVGADAYATEAYARGENIVAVLNADMIGWEGDGQPTEEDLDLNLNDASAWLGAAFVQAAADYGTGLVVDAFLCPNMVYSDHAAFWFKGWSAVCGITDNEGFCGHVGHYPYYHTSDDTIANCGDPGFYVAAMRGYLATLAHLAEPLCRRSPPPANLSAVPDGDNRVVLSWDAVPGTAAYEIHRRPGGCGASEEFYQVGETAGTSYVDTLASGGLLYGYLVRSRDATGHCLSAPGLCVEVTTTGDCFEPPQFGGIEAVTDNQTADCGLTASWPAAGQLYCGSAARFNLYRSTDPVFDPAPANLVASCLTQHDFVDGEVVYDTEYFYVARAEDDTTGHAGPCGGNEDFNVHRASAAPSGPRTALFAEDFEAGLGLWLAESPWTLVAGPAHGGAFSAFGGNESHTCAALTMTAPVALPPAQAAQATLWTSYELESTYDGVQLQLSNDGGATWQLVEPDGGYTGTASASCAAKIGTAAWNGSAPDWLERTADLASWAGESVLLRFVMASDGSVNDGGFYLDDLEIAFDSVCEPGAAVIFADDFESGDLSAWE